MDNDGSYERRPPPITVPSIPPSRPMSAPNASQNSPVPLVTPLTSPTEQDAPRPPQTGSSRSRTSAKTTFSSFREQNRSSPRKSDVGSVTQSQYGSTTRSRHSGRSHRTAVTEPAISEEGTSRAQIESHLERNLLKMTGQVPPTPIAAAANDDHVVIRTHDLRDQCRVVSGEKQHDSEELAKSPKKKLFGNIRNPFTKNNSNEAEIKMPLKAAQVFGTSARTPHVVQTRPIKPPHPLRTPPKTRRSDTAKSLPAKVADPEDYARRHRRNGSIHRPRGVGRRSPKNNNRSPNAENTPLILATETSFDFTRPPTPPAKDTPPQTSPTPAPSSPLRRTIPVDDLRESYSSGADDDKLRFPAFTLSPTPFNIENYRNSGLSPTKFRPYTAEDYSNLIRGEASGWLDVEGSGPAKQGHDHNVLTSIKNVEALREVSQLPHHEHWKDDVYKFKHRSHQASNIPPRFYLPSDPSSRSTGEYETPSRKSNIKRFSSPNQFLSSHPQNHEQSNRESIEMTSQNDTDRVCPELSATDVTSNGEDGAMGNGTRLEQEKPTIRMQDLRLDGGFGPGPPSGASGYLQPETSSSRLTDLLKGASFQGDGFNARFDPACPSAVPSPLHKVEGSIVPASHYTGLYGPRDPPRSMEELFHMTNEHLDVVGKTTWDILHGATREHLAASNAKHDQLVNMIEELKSQMTSINEKTNRSADTQNSLHSDIEKVLEMFRAEVSGALSVQDQNFKQLKTHVKELQTMVQGLHNVVEQKMKDSAMTQPHTAESLFSQSNSDAARMPAHHSQPSLVDYYGSAAEFNCDVHPAVAPGFITSPTSSHSNARGEYGNGFVQRWGNRQGHPTQSNREQFAYQYSSNNGYNNGYNGNHYGSHYSPSSAEQQYGFNQNPGK